MTLNKRGKLAFVNQYSESIKSVINNGYDCGEAIVLEILLKTKFAYNKDATRKSLLSSFIKVFCEVSNPGHIVVGGPSTYNPNSANMDEAKYITNAEIAARMDLNDRRILDFISHTNIVNK